MRPCDGAWGQVVRVPRKGSSGVRTRGVREGEVVGRAVANEEQASGAAGRRSVRLYQEKASVCRVGCGRAGRAVEDERGWSEWAGSWGKFEWAGQKIA